MTTRSPRTVHEKELITALLSLKSEKELYLFLRDLLSDSELTEISKRWKAARMLENGESYPVIIAQTGLSSTTVARISRWLKQGAGGYRLAIERAKKS